VKVLITGSTGMIGKIILDLCIQSDKVSEVVTIVRKSSNDQADNKCKELIINDFTTYDDRSELFQDVDVAFFCIGVYTGQVSDEEFKKIMVDYAVNFAKLLKKQSPNARYCLLSGAGADRTEKRRAAFGRYKGMAENQIAATGIEFYTFRPGYIYPVEKRKEPNMMYSVMRSLYPLVKLFGKNASIKSTELAEAMFLVGIKGGNQEIYENRDMLKLLGV